MMLCANLRGRFMRQMGSVGVSVARSSIAMRFYAGKPSPTDATIDRAVAALGCPLVAQGQPRLGEQYPAGGFLDLDNVEDGIAWERRAEDEVYARARDAHQAFRDRYLPIIQRAGRELYPVILSIDNEEWREGRGGTLIFRRADGETYEWRQTGRVYELLKTVAHVMPGLYTLLGPYVNNNKTRIWHEPLRGYRGMIANVAEALANAEVRERQPGETLGTVLEPEDAQRLETTLQGMIGFCDSLLASGDGSSANIRRQAAGLIEPVQSMVARAARIQVSAMVDQLLRWKAMCSPEEWRRLYAVVNGIWVVSVDSPREVALRLVMDPEQVASHLIVATNTATPSDALTLLGRIITDRYASRLVFSNYDSDTHSASLVHSLSSPRDLMADGAYAAAEKCLEEHPELAVAASNLVNPSTHTGVLFNENRPDPKKR